MTFDWRHGLCRIAMDGGSSTWDIPLVAPRAAEGDGVRCVVEVPTTAAAADGATDMPPWTLPPTWRRVAHVRSARDKAARTLPTLADNPDRPASYTADELVRIVTERAAAAHEPEDMLAFQAARERVLRAGYHGAFGESIQGRPPMKCKPVSIDVGGHKPIYTAPYHLHKGNDDIIEAAVDDMLRMGVVREGTSGWSSPIVLIKKPHTNLLRLCLDYRAVNAVTRSGPGGQLPSVRQCLRRMHGSSVFTTFDLSQAFWLMALDAAAQAVTAFATATRTLLWTRCLAPSLRACLTLGRGRRRSIGRAFTSCASPCGTIGALHYHCSSDSNEGRVGNNQWRGEAPCVRPHSSPLHRVVHQRRGRWTG